MRSLSVAQAKTHLSALLDAVQAGEEVEITRRGIPVARLTRAPDHPQSGFDLAAFLAATTQQPMHPSTDGVELVQQLRESARY
ncbi:type II toxin-antitoxin system Phd/YefM family antitoxin [Vulcanococcus sp.]|jgi:prevent-host-death family protein|uniref:type II toxin-antitoxin system Phd/YefM family antitoxin n=1 Tax=Vulcanococcus sp. TaxID=2856995 RepID=UPI0037DA2B6E